MLLSVIVVAEAAAAAAAAVVVVVVAAAAIPRFVASPQVMPWHDNNYDKISIQN